MKVEIFDVGHGGCAMVTGPTGKRLMIDCGSSADRPWFPSVAFCGEQIELLALMNLDEDHLDDLPYLLANVAIGAIITNPTITASALCSMKENNMRQGVSMAHALLREFGPSRIGPPMDLGEGAWAWAYWNAYGIDFTDTNNLSLAVFVRYGEFTILFAGDLETGGWRALLRSPYFRADLATVRVLVASHHGRLNGQCNEVFTISIPDVVVFSDGLRQYESQDTDAWYRRRVTGIPNIDAPFHPSLGHPMRHVLTTRRDGTLSINIEPWGFYHITPERHSSNRAIGILLAELLARSSAPVPRFRY